MSIYDYVFIYSHLEYGCSCATEKELLQRELSSAQEEAKDLGRSLAEASENYTRAAEALGDSQKSVQRLTSTLEGVSDAREQLEASLQSAKVLLVLQQLGRKLLS